MVPGLLDGERHAVPGPRRHGPVPLGHVRVRVAVVVLFERHPVQGVQVLGRGPLQVAGTDAVRPAELLPEPQLVPAAGHQPGVPRIRVVVRVVQHVPRHEERALPDDGRPRVLVGLGRHVLLDRLHSMFLLSVFRCVMAWGMERRRYGSLRLPRNASLTPGSVPSRIFLILSQWFQASRTDHGA